MSNPFVAEIRMFGGNFAPKGWALCNGQLLTISSNTALFTLLGTTYGGDGMTTFALPDFRGRVPTHFGQGPGLSNYTLGETGGVESVALTVQQMAKHNHLVHADGDPNSALGGNPANNYLAATGLNTAGANHIYSRNQPPAVDAVMNPNMLATAGKGLPHTNLHPFLTVTFIIALQGIYPSQN